jgi:hypothetical protein
MFHISKILIKLKKLLVKVLNRLKSYHAVVITFESSNPKNVMTKAEIKLVNWENVDDALTYEPKEKVKAFHSFLGKGDLGYYGYLDGEFAHRSWVTFGPGKINQWHHFVPLTLKEGEAVIHWCETTPKARGFNIYPAVLNKIVCDIGDQFEKIYIFTTRDNVGSFKGILKAGFIPVNAVEVYAFMGITIYKTKKVEKVIYEFNRANTI